MFDGIFDGKHGYFYRPQGNVSEYSMAIVNDGSGVISFDVFTSYAKTFLKEQKLLVKSVIDQLLPSKIVEFENLPSYAVIGVNKNDANMVIQIKVTTPQIKNAIGIIEDHMYLKECTVSVAGKGDVYALPNGEKVDVIYKDDITIFKAQDILGYKAFSFVQAK